MVEYTFTKHINKIRIHLIWPFEKKHILIIRLYCRCCKKSFSSIMQLLAITQCERYLDPAKDSDSIGEEGGGDSRLPVIDGPMTGE